MSEANRARIHGVPGDRARAAGVMRAIWPLLAALFACGLFVGAVLPRVALGAAGAGFFAAALFLAWAVRDGLKGIDSFFKGARGEESVAVLLKALPGGFHVFHDYVCGGCAIDHVVVGPNGVFVVETKCWSGVVTCEDARILVNGSLPSRPPLVQARASAQSLGRFLAERMDCVPACVPVVCFASDTFQPERVTADDVVVCNASVLTSLIVTHAGHLSSDEVERIIKMMEQKEP